MPLTIPMLLVRIGCRPTADALRHTGDTGGNEQGWGDCHLLQELGTLAPFDSACAAPMRVEDGERIILWFDAFPGERPAPSIHRCDSDDGVELRDCAVVLGPDSSDEPGDALGVHVPHVLLQEGIWRMWYVGLGEDGRRRLFHARSEDGWSWASQGLFLDLGSYGYEDGGSLYTPHVWWDGELWRLLYAGLGDGPHVQGKRLIGACSEDLEVWEDLQVVMEPGCHGELDAHNADGPWVWGSAQGPRLLYDGLDGFDPLESQRRLFINEEVP